MATTGFILAAGLGTRLRPFTLENPKALVPVGGEPMLKRLILKMKNEGITNIYINIHHFGEKIIEYLAANDNFGVEINISDERDLLRDTGGGLQHQLAKMKEDGMSMNEPLIIHNVDILSNAPLQELVRIHLLTGAASSLLVSDRESSRKLLFDKGGKLRGWHHLQKDRYLPERIKEEDLEESGLIERAFSGIYVVSPEIIFEEMRRQHRGEKYSIIDFFLEAMKRIDIEKIEMENIDLMDIGKPATLSQANRLF